MAPNSGQRSSCNKIARTILVRKEIESIILVKSQESSHRMYTTNTLRAPFIQAGSETLSSSPWQIRRPRVMVARRRRTKSVPSKILESPSSRLVQWWATFRKSLRVSCPRRNSPSGNTFQTLLILLMDSSSASSKVKTSRLPWRKSQLRVSRI